MGAILANKAVLYDRLMDGIQDYAVIVFDPEGKIEDWNLGAERIFGYAREEILGSPGDVLFTAEDRAKGESEAELRMARDESKSVDERWHVRKDGSRFWASGFLYRLNDGQGAVLGYVKVLRDVSKRKDSLLAIAEVEKKVEIFLENLKDHALLLINSQGRIASWNEGSERLFGYSETEILDQPFELLFTPEDIANGIPARELEHAGESGKAEDERWHKRKDGSLFWASGAVVPISFQGKQARTYVKILRDATERKRLEEAQKLESIGRLAGGVAHDFNNLLTTITGYAEMLAAWEADEEKKREWALEIKRAGDRAATLTAQLLAYGRKQVLSPRIVNVNGLLVGMGALLKATLGDGVELSLNLASDLDEIQFDPGQLEQVILNVVLNAKEASPRGGRVFIETSNLELRKELATDTLNIAPGRYVLVKIADTGVGMDPGTMARIFEPFFSTKKPGGNSTGLGLSAAFGILNQSGGGITVASGVGRGSEFRIYLSTAKLLPARWKDRKADAAPEGRRKRILLVEDEAAIRQMVCQALESSGFGVLEAGNGREGLELFLCQPESIDLILSDVVMPGMNGIELAGSIQSTHPETPVFLMSGFAEEIATAAGDVKPAYFIRKPFSLADLIGKVESILKAPGKDSPNGSARPEIV